MTEILIDDVTQNEIKNLAIIAQEANAKIQMICNIYVRSSGGEGDYALSQDITKLIKREEIEE